MRDICVDDREEHKGTETAERWNAGMKMKEGSRSKFVVEIRRSSKQSKAKQADMQCNAGSVTEKIDCTRRHENRAFF